MGILTVVCYLPFFSSIFVFCRETGMAGEGGVSPVRHQGLANRTTVARVSLTCCPSIGLLGDFILNLFRATQWHGMRILMNRVISREWWWWTLYGSKIIDGGKQSETSMPYFEMNSSRAVSKSLGRGQFQESVNQERKYIYSTCLKRHHSSFTWVL